MVESAVTEPAKEKAKAKESPEFCHPRPDLQRVLNIGNDQILTPPNSNLEQKLPNRSASRHLIKPMHIIDSELIARFLYIW